MIEHFLYKIISSNASYVLSFFAQKWKQKTQINRKQKTPKLHKQ